MLDFGCLPYISWKGDVPVELCVAKKGEGFNPLNIYIEYKLIAYKIGVKQDGNKL